jgi:hypothetical protein
MSPQANDWNQHKLMVTTGLNQVQLDIRKMREDWNKDALRISTEIATLRATSNHQARMWGLVAGAVPSLLILLLSKLWS